MEAAPPSSNALPIAPVVVIGTPDVSLAGTRLLLAATKPASSCIWDVNFTGKYKEASCKLVVNTPDGKQGPVVQFNFGDSKNPSITFLSINTIIPMQLLAQFSASMLEKLVESKVKSLVLLSVISADARVHSKQGEFSGNVRYSCWNGHPTPDLKPVSNQIRTCDPLLCSLIHYSMVLELPTLSLNLLGYRYQPRSLEDDSNSDGTEDIALSLSHGFAKIPTIPKTILKDILPNLKRFRSLKPTREANVIIRESGPGRQGNTLMTHAEGLGSSVDNRRSLYI